MSTEPVTEADVEKLREWVDDLRVKQPPEAPKAPAVHDPKPTLNVLKAPSEISAGAKLTQKIIESMDLRRQERARLVAALKSREVEVERENREAKKRMDDGLEALEEETQRRASTIKADFECGAQARQADLRFKNSQIEKLDVSLANLRTQLNAEISKLDPESAKGGA